MRRVANGIRYRNRTGCPWRMPPTEYGPWQTAYYYFRAWAAGGAWGRIDDALREAVRAADGRDRTPSAGGTDSQAVKATEVGGDRGLDQARKATGQAKKRHTAADSVGLLLAVVVTGAGASGARGAERPCDRLGPDRFPRLALVWADSKYHNHALYARMRGRAGWRIEVASRPPGAVGRVPPRRWVVERTYARIGRRRANSKDHERCNGSSEGMVYAASVGLMLNRSAPGPKGPPFRYRGKAA